MALGKQQRGEAAQRETPSLGEEEEEEVHKYQEDLEFLLRKMGQAIITPLVQGW